MGDAFESLVAMIEATTSDADAPEQLLPRIDGRDCNFCDDGELARGEHRGMPAVVCEDCDVPQITFC